MSIPHVPVIEGDRPTWIRKAATTVNLLIRAVSGGFLPGDLKPIAGPNIPDGWLLCDGSSQSRTTYPDLYAAIGTTWGPGDASNTFALPDLRNRILIGAGDVPLADTGGADEIALTEDNLPAHSHDVTDPGHAHMASSGGFVVANGEDRAALGEMTAPTEGEQVSIDDIVGNVPLTATEVSGITVNSAGGGEAFSILPPVAGVQWIIKT